MAPCEKPMVHLTDELGLEDGQRCGTIEQAYHPERSVDDLRIRGVECLGSGWRLHFDREVCDQDGVKTECKREIRRLSAAFDDPGHRRNIGGNNHRVASTKQ